MEKKKNRKTNLENYRRLFLLIGLFVSIGVVGSLFSWKSTNEINNITASLNIDAEDELVQIIRHKPIEKVEIEPIKKQNEEIIKIVNNEANIKIDFVPVFETNEFDYIDFEQIDEDTLGYDPDIPVFVAEKSPVYPGGLLALRRHIANNINYPVVAKENNVEGTVFIRFVVLKSGKIGEIQVLKGADKLMDNEAIRVIKTLKKFKPGQQGGKNVSVWYSLPIAFKLN